MDGRIRRSSPFAVFTAMDTEKDLVIGIGNRLVGDDGAGPAVVQGLREVLPDTCLVELTTPGYDLLTHLDGRDRVFIVDAAQFGGAPGEVRRASRDAVASRDDNEAFSMHGLDLLKLLDMAEKSGLLPDTVVLFLIQAQNLEAGMDLTPAVARGVEETVRRIREEIGYA